MRTIHSLRALLSFIALALLTCSSITFPGLLAEAHAEIAPEQVAVIYNTRVEASEKIARHYAEKRDIPTENLIPVTVTSEDTIERAAYESAIVAPVRSLLQERKIAGKVKLLVTVYGVPLRVATPEPNEEEKKMLLLAQDTRKKSRDALNELAREIEAFPDAPKPAPKQKPSPTKAGEPAAPGSDDETDEALLARVDLEVKKTLARLKDTKGADTVEIQGKLGQALSRIGGVRAIVQLARPKDENAAVPGMEKIKSDMAQAEQILKALSSLPSYENRARGYSLAYQIFGSAGLVNLTQRDLVALRFEDGDASVDSELSLVWWDRTYYSIAGRLPNPYFHQIMSQTPAPTLPVPILLTGRIDAPTPALAMKMIDMAVEAEKKGGPEGTVYIDAQGKKSNDPADTYAVFDQSLRDLGWLIREESDYTVKIDDFPSTLSKPGSAPDVALYVGWYKLRSYEDVFTFNPGAIGVHIASEEAISLHNPEEKGWCKNALERGITATLGATGEPFLEAFPKPLELFGLMMTGKYSYVEAYALTAPWLSWRLTLIGDPLYNPWKDKDWLDGEEIVAKSESAKTLNPLPKSPIEFETRDPLEARAAFEAQRENLKKQLDEFYRKVIEKAAADQKKAGAAPAAPGATKGAPKAAK